MGNNFTDNPFQSASERDRPVSVPVSVSLTAGHKIRLDAIAAKYGMSASEVVRTMIDHWARTVLESDK